MSDMKVSYVVKDFDGTWAELDELIRKGFEDSGYELVDFGISGDPAGWTSMCGYVMSTLTRKCWHCGESKLDAESRE